MECVLTHRDTGEQFDAEEVMRRVLEGRTIDKVEIAREDGRSLLLLTLSDTAVVKLPFDMEDLIHLGLPLLH